MHGSCLENLLFVLSFSELQNSPSSALLAADGGYCEFLSLNFSHEQPLERSDQSLLSRCLMLFEETQEEERAVKHLLMFQSNFQSCTKVHLDVILSLEILTFRKQLEYLTVKKAAFCFYFMHWIVIFILCCIKYSLCVCSIAEGCTLKLVLAMRGGPINTRRGKEHTKAPY